ncbi:MAG: ABC transporter substrate-binding protein [Sphingopyxis sp.]|uniref:ABC transporter substrate-binding protein n=1 Tax=Sphingopyxis sp. TaxID=1908224 RepID=UPI002ABB392E|nr:ABC transporter substrate-binding protein [Sphingopyxis sp.]MDZ3831654.1 ABC transporter substrate-binding protein [Sphingopyxis sp.]
MHMAKALALLILLSGCQQRAPLADRHGVVSIDYCADQMAIGLLPRRDIRAISFEANSDVSFSAPRAKGIARLRPTLEEIIALRPAVVIRSYGGDTKLAGQLEKLGIRVVQLGYAVTLTDVRTEMLRVGHELDADPRARALLAHFDAELQSVPTRSSAPRPRALYVTPGDVTTGPGSLVASVIETAGFVPYRQRPGWGTLPLEDMARRPPDLMFRAFFDSSRYQQDRWTSSRHPVVARVASKAMEVEVPGAWLACGNWLSGHAVARLAAARKQMQ